MMDYSAEYVQQLIDEAHAEATRIERQRCLAIVHTKIREFHTTSQLNVDERLACIYLIDVYHEIAKDEFEHGILEAGKILNGEKT